MMIVRYAAKILVALALLAGLLAWLRWPWSGPVRTPPAPENAVVAPAPTAVSQSIPVACATNLETGVPALPVSTMDPAAQVLARLRAWDDHDDADSRPQRLQELDALLAGTNALELVQSLPPELLGYAFATSSLRQRLLADPAATLDWMRAHPHVFRTQALTFLHDWQQQDAGGLSQYLATLPDGDDKQALLAVAGNEAVARDPVATILRARELADGPTQTRLLQMATANWAGADPQAAVDWLRQFSDPDLQGQLADAFAAGYAREHPAQAADWLTQSLPPGPALNQAMADVGWTWALTQPAEVGAWAQNFPAGGARHSVMTELIAVWGQRDPAAMADWVLALTDDSLRAEAAEIYVHTRSPDAAPQ